MNKKIMWGIMIPLFAIVLVSAGLIIHYNLFQQEINVDQPIKITGEITQVIDCEAGTTCLGEEIKILNEGTQEISVSIINDAKEGIEVSYIGNLELTKKNVDFGNPVWEVIDGKVQIEYTIVGSEFSAEVVEGEIEGYELIYYPDNDDRFVNPSEVWFIDFLPEMNLPAEWDYNHGGFEGDYDYCLTEEYLTCHGAKIWYVPSDAINPDGSLVWGRANEFYFETELIQYNSEGNIITYPNNNLLITPSYELDIALEEGTYNIETQVNPTA